MQLHTSLLVLLETMLQPVLLRYELQRWRGRGLLGVRSLLRWRRRRLRGGLPLPLLLLRLADLRGGGLQRRAARHQVQQAARVLLLLRLVEREAKPI